MLKKLLFEYLHTGTRKEFDSEANRQIFTVNLFGLVGLLLTALMSVNAAVVGLLIAALYQPVFTSAVNNPLDIALVIAGFYAMKQLKLPILWLVLLFIFAGAMLGI